jgi:hypothetical protein
MASCLCATAVVKGSQNFLVKPVGDASPMVYPRLVVMHKVQTIRRFRAIDERREFFIKPVTENMLSTGTDDELNVK